MKLFFRILKIVFTVLGGLLLILLLFPVRLDLLWQDAVLTADVRYIFLRFRLSPKEKTENGKKETRKEKAPEEKTGIDPGPQPSVAAADADIRPESVHEPSAEEKRPEQEKKPEKEKKKEKTEKEEASLSETIEKAMRFISPLLRPGYWLFRMILRAVRVRDVSVIVSVTGSDPASIGFRSGIHWALIGNLMNTLNYLFGKNVTYGEVTVYPCFGDAEPRKEKISCSVSVQPLIVILLVLGFLLGYLFELVRNLLKRGGKKNVK